MNAVSAGRGTQKVDEETLFSRDGLRLHDGVNARKVRSDLMLDAIIQQRPGITSCEILLCWWKQFLY